MREGGGEGKNERKREMGVVAVGVMGSDVW